jgi:hypothetical protein
MLSPMKQRAMVRGLPACGSAACADARRQWQSDVLCGSVADGAPIRGSHREVAGIDARTQESNLGRLT